jgi:hypothetical protein
MRSAEEMRDNVMEHPPVLPLKPEEPLEAFCERHGGWPVKRESRWLFADGAEVFLAQYKFDPPHLVEPPDDPKERLFARREYALAKLGRSQSDFRRLKNALQGTGAVFNWDAEEYGDPPPDRDRRTGLPDGPTALRRLQSFVLKHREALEQIDREIDNLPESKEAQRRRKQNAIIDQERANWQAARQAEIASIEI